MDKIAYGSFVYTSLLYLSDFGSDFDGGEFVFVDPQRNVTIQPTKGRLTMFTSGLDL